MVIRIYSKHIVSLYIFVNAWSSCDTDGPTIAASGSPILQASRGNDGALPDGWTPSGKVPNFVVSQNVKREHHRGSIGKKLKPFCQLILFANTYPCVFLVFGVLTALVGIFEGWVLVLIVLVLEEGMVDGNLVGKHSHSFGCQIVGG